MHATYAFLLSLDGFAPGDPGPDDDDLRTEAEDAIESRFSDQLDDNNYYQTEALLLRDGRVLQLCPADDWRGRDGFYCGLQELPQAERWEHGRDWAARAVAGDMGLFGSDTFMLSPETEGDRKLNAMTCDDIVAAIRAEVPKMLAAMYAETPPANPKPSDAAWMAGYRRRKLAAAFEAIAQSSVAPFAEGVTPYTYRAFDLTGDGAEEANAILFVDIHT